MGLKKLWKKARGAVNTVVNLFRAASPGPSPTVPGPTPAPAPAPKPGSPQDEARRDVERDLSREFGKIVSGVVEGVPDAVSAVGHFIENTAHSAGDTLSKAERRIREGKIIDAWWHLGADPFHDTEGNALKAAQESALVRQGMQLAATVYGGPAGAAAFAAWYAYRTSNNIGLALRAAVIAYAVAYAGDYLDKAMPVANVDELATKAVVAGAIGGIAVAAAGGTAEDVQNGFLRSGGILVFLDGYEMKTGRTLGAEVKDGLKTLSGSAGGFFMRSDQEVAPQAIPGSTTPNLKEPPAGGISSPGLEWRITWIKSNFNTALPAVIVTYVGAAPLYPDNPDSPS